jgi:galactonate dehydratase
MKVVFEFNPPNAIIGNGIFLAKSLQASATLRKLVFPEFQHLVFCAFKSFTGDALNCENGVYQISKGTGNRCQTLKGKCGLAWNFCQIH